MVIHKRKICETANFLRLLEPFQELFLSIIPFKCAIGFIRKLSLVVSRFVGRVSLTFVKEIYQLMNPLR